MKEIYILLKFLYYICYLSFSNLTIHLHVPNAKHLFTFSRQPKFYIYNLNYVAVSDYLGNTVAFTNGYHSSYSI